MHTRLHRLLKPLAGLLLLGSTASSYALQAPEQRLELFAKGEIPWQSLSPEEQRQLKGYQGNWNNYDAQRQKRIRDGAQRYLSLPPERQEKIRQQRKNYRKLSPQEQKRLREEYLRNHR